MNREIKFRAWFDVKELKKRLIRNINDSDRSKMVYFDLFDLDSGYIISKGRQLIKGTPIMQYTGLKDKNGKEIYKSDVIKVLCNDEVSYNKFEVYYDPYSCRYLPNFAAITSGDIEIIGNIYENSALMEKK